MSLGTLIDGKCKLWAKFLIQYETISGDFDFMASTKQKAAAKKNIRKAASAAKRKHTIAHLPKSVRTALGKKGSSVAQKKRKSRG